MRHTFTRAYIEAIYFTETGDTGQPSTDTPLSLAALRCIARDCRDFERAARPLLDKCPKFYTTEQAGHDFWLTRNGHGSGFWDRGLGDLGKELSTLARKWGEAYPFLE